MGLISGILMGMIFGISLMAGWRHMMRYRSTKRVAKVRQLFDASEKRVLNFSLDFEFHAITQCIHLD